MRHRQPVVNALVRHLLAGVGHDEPPERNPFRATAAASWRRGLIGPRIVPAGARPALGRGVGFAASSPPWSLTMISQQSGGAAGSVTDAPQSFEHAPYWSAPA